MGIEHEVTPTLMELKDRIVSLETKLAAYEHGTDDADLREALEEIKYAGSPPGWMHEIISGTLRSERAKVAELKGMTSYGTMSDLGVARAAIRQEYARAESAESRVKELEAKVAGLEAQIRRSI